MLFILSCNRDRECEESKLSDSIIPIEIITEIGLADQPLEYQLGRPIGIRTDQNGNIFVGDHASLTIKVFNKEGKYVKSLGGRGRGPGEFQSLNRMELVETDTLWVFDRGKFEYIYLTTEGLQIDSHPVNLTTQMSQYYPKKLFWYNDKSLGLFRNGASPEHQPPPLDRPLFHIYSRDFQEHHESFFPFRELGYTEEEHFIWNSFGWIQGDFDMTSDKQRFVYSPGVYNGMLYEFARKNGQWKVYRTLQGTPPHSGPFDIYNSQEEYERYIKFPGVEVIYYGGGAHSGRLYSIDAGIYYLSDGRIVHFYGEWRGGDTTLEEGNTLDISAQIFEEDGTISDRGYIISVERDAEPSVVLVNWKDKEDNFYLLNLPNDDIPTVIKFRLDL
ncbi:MAG: 6-bladed beta-propeller [Balneolaceae bacterium]|nr:6-bladed beta-propeller [Balneolaceae bacterium]